MSSNGRVSAGQALLPSLARMVTCPRCFKRYPVADCAILSARTGAILWRPGRADRLLGRLRPRSLSLPELAAELPVRQCPGCRAGLPPNVERARSIVIGLLGTAGSGKTHLLAALLHELEAGAALGARGSPVIADQDVHERADQAYLRPLFTAGRALEPTPPLRAGEDNRPLIYTALLPRGRRRRVTNLVFFDAAGSQLADAAALAGPHRYVLHGSALLFLVDPWSLPAVAARLPARLRPDDTGGVQGAARMLATVADLSWRRLDRPPGSRIGTPLAVVISKGDLLGRALRALGVNLDLPAGASAAARSAQVEKLMVELGGRAVVESARMFARRSFHVASATGMAPQADGTYLEVSPSGCVAPLLWALRELGAVEGRGLPAAA